MPKKTLTATLLIVLIMFCSQPLLASQTDHAKAQGGTGFRINFIRTLNADDNTVYKEDGELINEIKAQGGTGYKIRYKSAEFNPNAQSGTLQELELVNNLKGPVIATQPLQVFGVDNLITGSTQLVGLSSVDTLELGDELKISGYTDLDSNIIITRIEKVDALSDWKLSGYVSAISPTEFSIGNQVVFYHAGLLNGCGPSLDAGEYVEITAQPTLDFKAGDALDQVDAINCVDPIALDEGNDVLMVIEGTIDALPDESTLILNGQTVKLNSSTQFIRGQATDLQQNIKIEVEGDYLSATDELLAGKVRFLLPRFNWVVPVEPQQVTADLITVAGQNIIIPPQVSDPDQVLESGLLETTRLQLRGYVDSDALILTRVNVRGQVDYDEVDMTGLVTGIDAPLLELFGVTIDLSMGEFFNQDQAISFNEFFKLVEIGAEVEIESASLDQQTGSLSAGRVVLLELPGKSLQKGSGNAEPLVGIGTLSDTTGLIFASSFEPE